MKHKFLSILILSLTTILFVSCNNDADIDVAQMYPLNVTISIDEKYTNAGGDLDYREHVTTAKIEAVNQQTSRKYVVEGEYSEIWQIKVPAGEYNVSAFLELDESVQDDIISFNGTKNNLGIYSKNDISVGLTPVVPSPLIFKEIYYSMCKTSTNESYIYDQFYEIYNNSAEIQYLDNCVLARHQGSGSAVIPCRWVDANGEILKEYPTDSYIAAFVGDGSGKSFPLEPGKSVVIAFQARNHKISNSTSVDLSGANYEVNISDWKTNYVNNPDVPDMKIITKVGEASYAFWMGPYSGTATMLAKFPDDINLENYVLDMSHWKTIPFQTASTELYFMIPQEYIMDGINIVGVDNSKRQVQFRSEIDAGMVTNSENYNGKSIKRKVKKEVGDRIVYLDTNNSTEDFLTDQIPTPGIDANGKVINK